MYYTVIEILHCEVTVQVWRSLTAASHLQHASGEIDKLELSEPLSPHHRRPEVVTEVPQDEDVVSLRVDLEEADVVHEGVRVVGLEEGRESHGLHCQVTAAGRLGNAAVSSI